jgi:DNA-directed RNA polymerase subunit RPC12/RpoP
MDIWEKDGEPFDFAKTLRWKIYRCIGCRRRLRKADKRRIARYENGLVCQKCDNKEMVRLSELMRAQKNERWNAFTAVSHLEKLDRKNYF